MEGMYFPEEFKIQIFYLQDTLKEWSIDVKLKVDIYLRMTLQ